MRRITPITVALSLAIVSAVFGNIIAPAQARDENRSACTERVTLDNLQVRELIKTIRDTKADTLDRAIAYENMVCEARDSFRQLALQSALSSNEPALQAAALLEVVMLRDNLIVEIDPGQDLGAEGAKWKRKTGGSVLFNLTNHNRAMGRACTSCCPCYDALMDVSGLRLNLAYRKRYSGERGEFKLADDGTMKGLFYVPGVPTPMKATLKLF